MGRISRRSSGARLALAAVLAAALPWTRAGGSAQTAPPAHRQAAAQFRLALRSPDLASGKVISPRQVYDGSGCHGGNTSPALAWTHPPAGTRSFAVLMLDTDAPGGDFGHWAVFDIPAQVRSLRSGAGDPTRRLLPQGALQTRNDWGSLGYGGPCPPPGPPHHYHLILYALRVARLGLDPSASLGQVAAKVRAEALAEAQIIGVYGR